jgi:hypothetical protein
LVLDEDQGKRAKVHNARGERKEKLLGFWDPSQAWVHGTSYVHLIYIVLQVSKHTGVSHESYGIEVSK